MLESVQAEFVQQRRHRDMRVVRHRIPQRQRAIGGQLAQQAVRQRLDGILLVFLGLGLAADRDDGTLDGRRGSLAATVRIAVAAGFAVRIRAGRCLILRTDVPAIDREAAIRIDADEDTGASDLGEIVADRPILEGGEHRFDLAETSIDVVGKLVGVLVLHFELGVLALQRLDGRLFLGREVGRRPFELA